MRQAHAQSVCLPKDFLQCQTIFSETIEFVLEVSPATCPWSNSHVLLHHRLERIFALSKGLACEKLLPNLSVFQFSGHSALTIRMICCEPTVKTGKQWSRIFAVPRVFTKPNKKPLLNDRG
jgi:hypothetical protein